MGATVEATVKFDPRVTRVLPSQTNPVLPQTLVLYVSPFTHDPLTMRLPDARQLDPAFLVSLCSRRVYPPPMRRLSRTSAEVELSAMKMAEVTSGALARTSMVLW